MFSTVPSASWLSATTAMATYGTDTGGASRALAGAVLLHDRRAVPELLAQANAKKIKLWPISGGRNFGYGTSLPVEDDLVVVDMSGLKSITYHAESQTFTLEPGVTQGDLAKFLDEHSLPYLVPTTGVGPNGSLLGNALDGGYGLTPVADHFEALTDIEGFWGNGEPFAHAYQDMGCPDMARRWSAGLGPSTQSLLRQGNFGLVTRATVRLARVPEACRVLVFEWPSDEAFLRSQPNLSKLTEELPLLGGIIAMNAPRVLSTQADAPLTSELRGAERVKYLDDLARAREISAWTGVGTLYGPKSTLRGAVRDIRRRLPGVRVWAFTPKQIRLLQGLVKYVPSSLFQAKRRHLGSMVSMLGTVEGRPITAFLRIAYALDATTPAMDVSRNPAKDGQGILWYAPLVPLTSTEVASYIGWTSEVLTRHGFDPLLAVTTRSSRVHSGTIPLNFRKTPEDIARAKACYEELVATGIRKGMPPYRIGVDYMDKVYATEGSPLAKQWQSLKLALDPNDIITPGRYVGALD